MSKEKKDEFKIKIQKNNNNLRELTSDNLKSLINKYGIACILPQNILKEKPIVYLLRNGFIDETYPNYLTYFYENNLSAIDMNFILRVRNHESFEFTYKLIKLKELVAKLNLYEFEQEEILNFSLMDYLLENRGSYYDKFNIIIKQLTNESSISVKFIDEFIEKTMNLPIFFNTICKEWHNLWNYIEESEYTSSKKNDYLVKILEYADLEDIEILNCNGSMTTYITATSNFLKLVNNINVNKIKNVILKLKIKFINLDTENINQELADYIFDNNNYCINFNMIEAIMKVKAPESLGLFLKSNLSTIKRLNYTPLLNYIDNNLEKYIQEVFLKINENTNEDIETIVVLLNRDLLEDSKNKIVIKEEFKLSDITVVPEELWDIILSNRKLEVNWNNVFYYFKKTRSINSILVDYLNKTDVYFQLSENKFCITDEEEKIIHQDLFKQLILSEITCASLEALVKSFPYSYNNFEMENIIPQKIDILINNKVINFTVENYSNLKDNFKDKHIKLIVIHKQEYINEQEKYIISTNDMLNLLELSCFENVELLKIIQKIDVSIINKELAKIIYEHILHVDEKFRMNVPLFNKVWNEIEANNRLKILIDQFEFFDLESIKNYLNELGQPYSQIIQLKKKPKLYYTEMNFILVEKLYNKGLISSYNVSEKFDISLHNNVKIIRIINKNKEDTEYIRCD